MNQIPSIWRIELFHPQFVHFSIALLITGSLLWLIAFIFKHNYKNFLSNSAQLLIVIGTAISWITIYTGTLADGEVGRALCNPIMLKSHESNAYNAAWIFSGISILFLLQKMTSYFNNFKKYLSVLILLLILAGNAYLFYTSHLGAKVVYQQGGGVYHPSKDCSEFK